MGNPALANLSGLDWTDIRLLEELAFLSQDHGYSTPGRQYLANTIGVSIRSVSRHISKLVKLGFLQRIQRSYRKESGEIVARTNLYRVAVGIGERIQAFLGSLGKRIGQRINTPSTDGTRVSRIPKAKTYISNKVGAPPKATPINPLIFEKMPLLKRWLERGQTV